MCGKLLLSKNISNKPIKLLNRTPMAAKSVLIEGTPPLGMNVVEGDLRQVYDTISPGETIENRVFLKATEAGNFTLHLRMVYNDNPIGITADSEPITVTETEKNYLYVVLPLVVAAFGLVTFVIKRHREYSY